MIKYISEQSFSFSENLLKTFSRLLQFNIFVFWGHLFIEDQNFSRFIMMKNKEIFCDLSTYWLSLKSMQGVETRNISKWCYKMRAPLLQTSTSNSNINVIMLIPHSILLFVFKSSMIICFILIIKWFFSNTNFTSSNNPLTPL